MNYCFGTTKAESDIRSKISTITGQKMLTITAHKYHNSAINESLKTHQLST